MTGYAKVTRDFTDRKRAEEAVMLQLSSALLANMDVRKLLGAISASLREVVPHDARRWGFMTGATVRIDRCSFWARRKVRRGAERLRLPLEGSPAGRAFRNREPVIAGPDQGFAVCNWRRCAT